MGLQKPYLDYIEKFMISELGRIDGKLMLELGDQVIRNPKRHGILEKTGKSYFTNKGVHHTSIDLNGKKGSVRHDLSKSIINPYWVNHFDIITNSGTSEHIEPFESQYICFKNIHNFLSVGGIFVHIVPDANKCEMLGAFKRKHCNYYYTNNFFIMLAKENNYKLLDSILIGGLRAVCLKKLIDHAFMKDQDLFLSMIVRKFGAKEYKFN